ncbi:MAG: hypothetical protein HC836_16925 [Richelia sp. RM2_1_2]|nr:hypothetical protein [Richelia sp. RM2_1_2]
MSITMFDDTDQKGIKCIITFNETDKHYNVLVSYKDTQLEESFLSMYDPIFGMDVSDRAKAMEIAENFALQIEEQYELLPSISEDI